MEQTIEVILPPLGEDRTYIQTKGDCQIKITTTEPVDSIDVGDGVKITGKDLIKETVRTFPYRQILEEEKNLIRAIAGEQELIANSQKRLDEIAAQKLEIEPKAEIALNV